MMKNNESHSSVAPLNIKSGAPCRQLFTARLQHSLLVHAVQSPGNERDAEIVARSGPRTGGISRLNVHGSSQLLRRSSLCRPSHEPMAGRSHLRAHHK